MVLGAEQTNTLGLAMSIPLTVLAVLLVPPLGGAWQEPGFRGLAPGTREARFGRITAPLVLVGIWVVWHLPLFVAEQILLTDVLVIIAASVVFAAAFHLGRESVLVAMLMHATNNAVGGASARQLFEGADLTRLGWLTTAGWWIAASIVIGVQALRQRGGVAVPEVPLDVVSGGRGLSPESRCTTWPTVIGKERAVG